jgi:hypothetical protein
MTFKKTLGSIVLAGAIALGGCTGDKSKPEYRNVAGKVYQSDQQELIYGDNQGFGGGKNIPVPVTFLGVEAEGKKYQIILAGPHNLKEGDSVNLDYLVDDEVTGKEIWSRFYPERADGRLVTVPNVRFKTDGYATVWKKE